MRLRPTRIVTAVAVSTAAVVVCAGPAAASDAGTLVADTNALRASHGVPAYRVCADLDGIAQGWAANMASTGSLAHNGDLANQMPGWDALAENVGDGGSAQVVEKLFEQSPDHLANLVSSTYEEVGIGTARSSNGTLWVDEVFREPSAAACSGSVAPAPAVTHAPTATSAPPVAPPTAASHVATPRAVVTPSRPTAAQLRQRLAAEQRTALRSRLSTGRASRGDVVGEALAFASLLRPVR